MAILNCEDRKKYPEFAKINFANYMLISKIFIFINAGSWEDSTIRIKHCDGAMMGRRRKLEIENI